MDIQLTQILFQIVNFSVVVGAVSYLLYKPVLKIFDERARRIAEGEVAANKAQTAYAEIEQQQKESEAELKREKARVVKEAMQEAQERKEQIIADAKEEAKKEAAKVLETAQKEKEQLLKDSQKDMADAVLAIAQKVIGDSLDAKAGQKLVDSELKNILKSL